MNTMMKRLGMTATAILAAVTFWACTATRHSDGSVTIEFAPDMVIRAWGLEDALGKLIDLQAACSSGTFPRSCSDSERDDILSSIREVLERKSRAKAANSLVNS